MYNTIKCTVVFSRKYVYQSCGPLYVCVYMYFGSVCLCVGIDSSGPLFGRLCGQRTPGSITTTTSLWLNFHSDNSIALKGFLASYTVSGTEAILGCVFNNIEVILCYKHE